MKKNLLILFVMLLYNVLTYAQVKTITGVVVEVEKDDPIPGVNVVEEGTTNGIITDFNGKYSINAKKGSVLVFSFIGMTSKKVQIGDDSVINISLVPDVVALDEVVAIGYGSQTKASITGAISAVESNVLLQSPVSNISNALVGRVSGLLTIQESGAPGDDGTTLRIRGVGTFTGNTEPLVMIDGIETQNYNNLDPNEIENISILKDASATAVYGVRGANGVLLITTKRGSVGKPKVSFSAQSAMSMLASERQYMNSGDWAKGYNEALRYDSYIGGSYIPRFSEVDIQHYVDQDSPLFYPNVDWAKLMLKPSTNQSQYNLNIRGGTDRLKYFISAGYFTQGGMFDEKLYDRGFDNSIGYDRYNFRSNFDFNISKRLTAKVNLSAQIDQQTGNVNSGEAWGYVVSKIFVCPPTYSPGIYDGKVVNLPSQMGSNLFNPLSLLFGGPWERSANNYLNGTLRFDYSLDFILKGLSAHGTFSYQNRNGATARISKTLVEYLAFATEGGGYGLGPMTDDAPMIFSESTSFNRREDAEVGLDYKRKLGQHSVTGLLLYNQSKEFPGPSLSIPRGYQGLVGRATYDYKKRYMAEFDFGYNGTENFAVGKRFGFFPAYSLGWVLSEESFFPKTVVSYLKFRGSYGEVGNDRIGGTRFLYNPSTYVYGGLNNYYFGMIGVNSNSYQGSGEGTLGNPGLTWERSKKLNVGFDLTLLKNIKIAVDYFEEKRDNILSNPGTVPNIVGSDFPPFNFGRMSNHGIDGEISYNGKSGKLNYWLKGVFTITDNVIEYMDESERPYEYQQRTGQRYQQTFGLVAESIYNTWDEVIDANRPMSQYSNNRIQPGDFRYKDVNGDGIINDDDQVPVGYSPFPGRSFGLSLGGDFKRFDLSVLISAASDYTKRTSHTINRGWGASAGITSTMPHVYERAWTQEKYLAGIESDFPRIAATNTSNHNYVSNTMWNENSSYVRLKNVEIGYTLTPTLLKKWGIGSVRVYANASNIITWDKLFPGEDPEIPTYNTSNNEPYPIVMTINSGININF